ncbi:hypothetical protein JZU54_07695, partial [bacterium]|nr:hypothetical protein [bacterium]
MVLLAVDCHKADDLALDALAVTELRDGVVARRDEQVDDFLFNDPRPRLALRLKLDLHFVVTLPNVVIVGLAEFFDQQAHRPADGG